jgi:hypothetical protein
VVGFGTLILYLPVFVMSGVSAVIANEYVQPINRLTVWQSMPAYTLELLWWLFGFLIGGSVLVVCSLFLKDRKDDLLIKLAFFCLALVPLICLLHSVLPFLRIWIYLVIAVAAAAAVSFEKLIAKLRLNIWTVSLLSLIILALGEFNYQRNILRDGYETRAAKASLYMPLLADESLRTFFVEEDSTSIYVDYYLTSHHRNYEMHYGFAEGFNAAQEYDCLILKADNPAVADPKGYKLIYADDISRIFVRSM